jgi:uncharacterized protein (UPF0371 family)
MSLDRHALLLVARERKRLKQREAQNLQARLAALSPDDRLGLLATAVANAREARMSVTQLSRLLVVVEFGAKVLSRHDREVVALLMAMSAADLTQQPEPALDEAPTLH